MREKRGSMTLPDLIFASGRATRTELCFAYGKGVELLFNIPPEAPRNDLNLVDRAGFEPAAFRMFG